MAKATVKRAAAIVMGGMIVSRILGYIRYKAIFYFFGRGFETDAFIGAFAVPDLLYILASGGALTAAFIPEFSGLLEKGQKKKAWNLASGIATIMFTVVGFGVGLGIIFAPQLVKIIVPGFTDSPETYNLCIVIVRIIFPMVILTSLSALLNGMLQSMDRFFEPAIAWCLHNLGIISAALLFHKILGIKGLAYGVLAGVTAMVAIQIPVIFKEGFKFTFSMQLNNPNVLRVLKLFLPAMLGMSISQINLMILPNTFGSFMEEGAVTALQAAVRLLLLPLGIFGSAISMAIFPTLSRQASVEDFKSFRRTFIQGTNSTFVFSLPSMVIFFTLGLPIARFLFGGGEFTMQDCEATALALTYYAIGLPGHTAIQVVSRAFYSLKDTRTPFYVGLTSVLIISIPFCLGVVRPVLDPEVVAKIQALFFICAISPFYHLGVHMHWLGYCGVALSVSMATLFNVIVLLVIFRRRFPDMNINKIWIALLKVGAASGIMFAACWFVAKVTAGFDPFITVAAGISVGFLVFLGVGRILKIEEIDELAGMLTKRFRRKGNAS